MTRNVYFKCVMRATSASDATHMPIVLVTENPTSNAHGFKGLDVRLNADYAH